MHVAPNMAATFAPPVMEARRWLAEASLPPGLDLLNVSQAAPVDPPPDGLRQAMAEAVINDPGAHIYGPVLGLPELRDEVAAQTSGLYGGEVTPDHVAITAGCNQAFAATIATLADPGDNVILPLPWYFNHKMWLDMQGVEAHLLSPGNGLLPDPEEADQLITPRTRAIVLVSPNNPAGVEYPPALMERFYDLAQSRGITLIVDETYRDFHSRSGPPHDLFRHLAWDRTLIQLYSFSKAYRLTGHRVGAIIAGPDRLREVEKFQDTVQICAPQLGQRAALWGMRNLSQWLAGERDEILARRAALEAGFARLEGWELLGAGAYFGYARHPFPLASDELARQMVSKIGVLLLPGTMFAPTRDQGGDGRAEQELRIAFANIDAGGIRTLIDRLSALHF